MNAIIVGEVNPWMVINELEFELNMVHKSIEDLVNNYTNHTTQQIADYIDLRNQEESIKSQLSN